MAFNRYLDREIDADNPRTRIREIPAGIISPRAALAFVLLNSAAFMVTTFFINRLCFFLSPVALAVVLEQRTRQAVYLALPRGAGAGAGAGAGGATWR